LLNGFESRATLRVTGPGVVFKAGWVGNQPRRHGA